MSDVFTRSQGRAKKIKILRDRGYTVRQIARLVGLKSPGAVQFYLNRTKQHYKSRQELAKENTKLIEALKKVRMETPNTMVVVDAALSSIES